MKVFDKVIMNPPYHIGGKIWDKVRKVSENIVCLMPLAQYKKNERYKYIDFFEVVNNHSFDAKISGNLCITTSQSMTNGKVYEDFLFDSFNQNYIKFYEWNKRNDKGLSFIEKRNKPYTDFDIDLDFVMINRAVARTHNYYVSLNGKGFDYYWNILKKGYEDHWIKNVALLHFDSKKAKDNFSVISYNIKGSAFIGAVLKGLNLIQTSINTRYAIPQIDWEKISDHPLWKEGKYDEAVLDTMGLKWEGDKIVEVR